MVRTVIPVILSGGSGTRLWPMSRPEQPKQFLPLLGTHSLFQETLARLKGMPGGVAAPIVVCNEAHRFLVAEQLRVLDCQAQAIVLEPAGRNTAPAIAVAAEIAARAGKGAAGGEAILLVLPADHLIDDRDAHWAAIDRAVDAAVAGHLVTFGIVPTRPETGYGYIHCGEERAGWSLVDRFVEKPDRETAERYLASGEYLWNGGMFVFRADSFLAEMDRHAPAMLTACRRALDAAVGDRDFLRLGSEFLECSADSIDYAVMEKTTAAAVVALDAGWSDVGSWDALLDSLEQDKQGNVLRGRVIADDCSRSYIAATRRLVAAVGLEDMVVVETEDAVLVMPRARSQDVKGIAERAAAAATAPDAADDTGP